MNAGRTPVVVDLGSATSRRLRDLKNGEGPLLRKVARVLEHIRAESPDLASKELIPVVMIYRRKRNRGSCIMPPLCSIRRGAGLPCPCGMGCK